MPTISLVFDARGAAQGAQEYERATDRISQAARRVAREVQTAQQAQGNTSGGAIAQAAQAQVTQLERVRQAQQRQIESERQLAVNRRRATQEQNRADAERFRARQRAEQAALTALSTLGGENRALAQRIQFERRLAQAVEQGVIAQTRANELRQRANAVFATQAVNARDLRTNIAGLNANFSRLSRTLSVLTFGPLSGVGARLIAVQSAAQLGGASLAGLAVGIGAAVAALVSLTRAGERAERSQLRLEGVIRATGGAAGLTAKQIEGIAESIGLQTLASTQGVREAAAALLTFRSIAGESFERTLRLAQDLAELGFGTIQTATVQLAKALEDPAANLSNLRRVGISVSASQRELIQQLQDSGQTAEAQAELFRILEQQIGGTGAAAAGGLAGAFDTLSENIGIYLERAADAIGLTGRLTTAIQAFNSAFPGDAQDLSRTPQSRLLENARQLEEARQQAAPFTRGLVTPGGPPPELVERINSLLREQQQIIAEIRETTAAGLRGEEEQRELRIEGITAAFTKLRTELDPSVKAQQDFNRAQRVINAAIEAGIPDAEQYGDRVLQLAQSAREAALGIDDSAEAVARLRSEQEAGALAASLGVSEIERENETLRARVVAIRAGEDAVRALNAQLAFERAQVEFIREAGGPISPDDLRRIQEAVAENERLNTELERIQESARQTQRVFDNLAENLQRSFGDLFTEIANQGVESFEDLGGRVRQILSRLSGETLSALVSGPLVSSLGQLFDSRSAGSTAIPASLGIDTNQFPLLVGDAVEEGARKGTERGASEGILGSADELAATISGVVGSAINALGGNAGLAGGILGFGAGVLGNLVGVGLQFGSALGGGGGRSGGVDALEALAALARVLTFEQRGVPTDIREQLDENLQALTRAPIPELRTSLDALNEDFERFRQQAEDTFLLPKGFNIRDPFGRFAEELARLEASLAEGRQRILEDFGNDLALRIQALEDPLGAALAQQAIAAEQRLEEARVAAAEGAADAVVQAEKLSGLERARIIEEFTRQANAPLERLLADIRTGDLGGRGTAQRLSEAQTQFEAARALAFAEPSNIQARSDFAAAARTLLELSREQFASSTQFFEQSRFIEATAEALKSVLPTSATAASESISVSFPEGSATADLQRDANFELAMLNRTVERLISEVGNLARENADLRAEISRLAAKAA